MRINKYLALHTGLSRRAADQAVADKRVFVNGQLAEPGQTIGPSDEMTLDGRPITPDVKTRTIMLNKPVGYVVSRDGQGSKTVYDLLPPELRDLKPVGRLDKDSSGLLLLTNDGNLAHRLTHPSFEKTKVYEVRLNESLPEKDETKLRKGIMLDDGMSTFTEVFRVSDLEFQVSLHEGRNRQIRRTFEALGYQVTKLHRTHFGPYSLEGLSVANYREL